MSGKAAAAGGIPASARRIVQSLKEIVNCPDAEIYAALKDCDMNPDEAVNRLLTQGTFHEVKSKREKKKDVKETVGESRPRTVNNNSRSRVNSDRGSRNSYHQSNSNDNQGPRVKSSNFKENDSSSLHTSSVLGPATGTSNKPVPSSGSNISTQVPAGILDGPSLSTQPPSSFQNSWSGLHGHMSMADVVKMGRPQPKSHVPSVPAAPVDRSYTAQYPAMPKPTVPVDQPSTQVNDNSTVNNNNVNESSISDEWTLVEEPPLETTAPFENYSNEERTVEGGQVAFSDRQLQVEDSVDDDNEINDGLDNAAAYQSQGHSYELNEVSVEEREEEEESGDFQQLSLQEEESVANNQSDNAPVLEDNNPAVIIPNHLQVSNADCAHLSFGSFGSGAFSGIFSQNKSSDTDMAAVENESSPVEQHTEAVNEEYYSNSTLNQSQNENTGTRIGTRVETLEMPSVSASEADVMRNESTGAGHGLQYNVPSVAFAGTGHPTGAEFGYPQGNTQLQPNLSAFSSLLQANSLLAQTLPQVRDFDMTFSPLVASQALPNKYMTAVPSTTAATMNMQDAAKQGVFSNQQTQSQNQMQNQMPTQTQTQAQTAQQTGPPLPQQHLMHPYSQPTLPLGPFTNLNLMGYPFMPPQSYTYLPSFQQPYSGNSNFHQSGAAVPNTGMKYTTPLPQYKNSISASSSVPQGQGSSVASGYGGFGGAGNVQGGFGVSGSGGGASTSLGFEDALSSQYKDMSQYMSLQQQSENPAMWLHGGAGSRTLSTMPANTFYSYQGQNQHGSFRQGQQPSQVNSLAYPNFYHPGGAQDHLAHQGTGGDAGLAGQQQPSSAQQQASHQLWQNSY